MEESKKVWSEAKRIVVKVGTSLVTKEGKGVDQEIIGIWAKQVAELKKRGIDVVWVSSGAVAEGVARLGWAKRPKKVHEQQAAAAVGQMGIIQAYEKNFMACGIQTAQILLTHADLANRERYLNARQTLLTLLDLNVVPIINENDTVITSEIKVGDNDTLGSLVTNLIDADILIILTDQIGLFTADPRSNLDAQLVKVGMAGDPKYESMAGGAASELSKGGMLTKVLAAKRASQSGASTIIVSGREKNVLTRLADGESIGTLLYSDRKKMSARNQWIADHLQLKGYCTIDDGAVAAVKAGKSLLPVGVKSVEGDFLRGEVIACLNKEGKEICRGLVNYGSDDARRIMGLHSDEIFEELGYMEQRELIHQDNMVVTFSQKV